LRRHIRRCTPRGTLDCTRGRRLIAFIDCRPRGGRKCDLTSQKGRSVVTGSNSEESTSHGITFSRHDVLEASHTRRASPLLAGCPPELLPTRAIRLPDKEFRYLRTVIVTAAVYRGLDSKLRPKANLSS